MENIRLKFIGHLGKFDNLDDFSTPFEMQSSMNDNPFATGGLPSAEDAFGSTMNSNQGFNDDEVPF